MMIEPGKRYLTRAGRTVRIEKFLEFTLDGNIVPGVYGVVEGGSNLPIVWHADGSYMRNGQAGLDLIEVVP